MYNVQKSVFLVVQIFIVSLILADAQSSSTQETRTETRQQRRADDALLRACQDGDLMLAKGTLNAGANVNVQNSDGNTPLILAAKNNQVQLIELLLQSGAKVIIQNDQGENAIDVLGENSVATRDKLQSAIAKDKLLAEQFTQAIFDKDTAKALELLKQGAYIDFIDKTFEEQATPLIVALDRGNFEVVKALVKAGARLERAGIDGATPLFYALNSKEITKLLIDAGANVNATGKDEMKPLMMAIRNKQPSIVQLLIEAGAEVNSADRKGNTPLHYAAYEGDLETIKFLLSKNAIVDKENKFHATPLHYAANSMHSEFIGALLKAGANPNKKSDKGYTPLMAVVVKGDLPSTKLLLQNGADANLTDDDGETALSIAQKEKQTEIAALLTPSTKTQPTNTTVAEMTKEVSQMKKEFDADQTRIMLEAVSKKDNFVTVSNLLKAGFPPNVKNEKGETALMIATDNEDTVTMNLLLDFGADINAQDNEGMTALMHAVAKNLLLQTANLLKKGAKKDIQDKKGRTALSIAKEVKGIVFTMYQKELGN
jgi:ankyrin repeat protein